ncbi:hypothetical protein [Lacihabitans soyangensis]|uniref:DUF4403 family protein n=1 Tax=Lacihabitans soyangensis TaxID=869394 RepID=A0AAE3KVC8_9BACT|nr:hypothetical protein [Lacihabitans soyangensis]MCP9764061.1 hypothetical protein [Lacihabitans soyangensis]
MKTLKLFVLLIIFGSLNHALAQSKASSKDKQKSNSESLKVILENASKVINDLNYLPFGDKKVEVKVEFQTEVSKTVNGELNVLIFKAEGELSKTKSNTVTYTYDVLLNRNLAPKSITEDLVLLIKNSISQMNSINDESIKPKGLNIKIEFTIEKTAGGGINDFKFIPLSASVDISKKAVHSIELEFDKE